MNARQRSFLVNLNRVPIFVLTLSGLLMDGLQFADMPCTVALVAAAMHPRGGPPPALYLVITGNRGRRDVTAAA